MTAAYDVDFHFSQVYQSKNKQTIYCHYGEGITINREILSVTIHVLNNLMMIMISTMPAIIKHHQITHYVC